MFTFAYFVNKACGTQYMFVGSPPSIGVIRSIYEISGPFFLLWVYGAMVLLHVLEVPLLKKVAEQIKQPLCVIFDTNYVLQKRCKIL